MMETSVIIQGHPVSFKDHGKGDVLVFLHGFTETSDIWNDFSKELSDTFRVVAIDLPGHGKTEDFGVTCTMELIASVVKEVLDHLQIRECLLIGHSMGGYATMAFAGLYPEMLRGMVLFHSQAAADSDTGKANRDRAISQVKADRPKFIHQFITNLFVPENLARYDSRVAELIEKALRVSPTSVIAALEGMKQRQDLTDVLAKVDFPVYFIAGKNDPIIQASLVMQQAALPAHSELMMLGNVAHMGFIESKEITLQAVRGFALRTYGLNPNN